jgi:cyd operon protein YbgT
MWYLTWILGVGVALAFGLVNALWYEARGGFHALQMHDGRATGSARR